MDYLIQALILSDIFHETLVGKKESGNAHGAGLGDKPPMFAYLFKVD